MTSGVISASGDLEDYLATQRWGFLVSAVVETGAVDWQALLQQCVCWVENPPAESDPAWEPYSSCERVANLLVFLAIRPQELGTTGVPPDLWRFLRDSARWIYNHLEYYGPRQTNNHILNNARTLVMAGAALPDAAMVNTGMRLLRHFVPQMVSDGGVLRERSSHYQLVVLNWMLDAWRFLTTYSDASRDDVAFLRGYVERMSSVAAMMCDASRLLAVIGDVSPDATPTLSFARLQRLYPEWWPMAAQLASVCQADGWFRMSVLDECVIGHFLPGPYPPAFPTHGHSDATSFSWLHTGADILVDPGRYRYSADPVSRFQRSACGHNVPLVNGFAPLCESVIDNGTWYPLPYARSQLETYSSGGSIELRHNGFARATPVSTHSRRLALQPGELSVVDSFAGHGNVELALCWHLGPGFASLDASRLTATGPLGELTLEHSGVVGPPRIAPLSGSAPGGWISQTYGQKSPAIAVRLSWDVALPAVVCTRFRLERARR